MPVVGSASWWDYRRLKYLWVAFYRSGDVLRQTPDDKSRVDPGKSAFADIDHNRLVAFGLEGDGKRYGVDLRTGQISENGRIILDVDGKRKQAIAPLRLIYFRRVCQNNSSQEQDFAASATVEYHIGWQSNDAFGRNVQRTLAVT